MSGFLTVEEIIRHFSNGGRIVDESGNVAYVDIEDVDGPFLIEFKDQETQNFESWHSGDWRKAPEKKTRPMTVWEILAESLKENQIIVFNGDVYQISISICPSMSLLYLNGAEQGIDVADFATMCVILHIDGKRTKFEVEE